MMAFGVAQIPSAKVDVFPEFAPPRVEIQTIALGNSSNEVEELITVPIEEQLNGLPGLDELRSKSVAQLSSIQLIFERGTDELRARQLVQERIAQVTPDLPSWASPPWMMPPLSATSRIMKIGLSSDDAEPGRDVVDHLLEDQAAPAARARRGGGGHLRRAAPAAPRAGRPGQAGGERRLARAGDGDQRRRRRRRRAAVHRELRRRHRRVRRGRRPAAERPPRAADRRAGGARRGARRRARTAGRCGWPTSARARGPPAGLGRGRRQRRRRPAADRPEVPRRQHDGGHARGRGRGGRAAPRAARHRDRHHDLPAGHVHRAVDRQPHDGAADRRRCS